MKFSRELQSQGRLTVRKNEDREKRERLIHKDKTLYQAYVCLHCEKKKCIGTDKCFREEASRGGKGDDMDG